MTVSAALAISGCMMFSPNPITEQYGKVYYLDGAGNLGGGRGIPGGLLDAGYPGDIQVFVWTTTFNPLLDPFAVEAARRRGADFGDVIADYLDRYPGNEVDIIAFSAGTGPAIWGIESLPDGMSIRNLVLLGSSLSSGYDAHNALGKMTGTIYNYHATDDRVLEFVPIVGSIDGKKGEAAAGSVGLAAPAGMEERVVNISRTPELAQQGWENHSDPTERTFVRDVLSQHIVP